MAQYKHRYSENIINESQYLDLGVNEKKDWDEIQEDNSFINSAILGAVTDSAILGGLLGGSFGGGILGDLLNGGDL